MTIDPKSGNIQPFWGPTRNTIGDSGIPSTLTLSQWFLAGVRNLRVIVPSEAFGADSAGAWSFMSAPLLSMRKAGFSVELALASDQRADATGKGGYQDISLVQTEFGRRTYAWKSAELVRLGGTAYTYDLMTEAKLPGNDPAGHDDLATELNALIFCYARRACPTAWLTLGLPMYSSPDQASNMEFFGDRYCSLGVDWFPFMPSGDYKQIDLDRDLPAVSYTDLVSSLRAQMAPAFALAKRTGRPLKIQQCGGVDLRGRNDWQTSRLLMGAKQVLTESGLIGTASWWTLDCFIAGGKQIPLASLDRPST